MKIINQVDVLATPSDLDEAGREKVCESLNELVADLFALYVKVKNYHWHMSGRHFRDYHLMLDEHAAQILANIDPLAERVRKLGANTIHSISHIADLQRVKDNDEEFVAPKDMLIDLINENKELAKNMRIAHEQCDDIKDVATASLLETYIDEGEERVWFLFEASRDIA